MKRIEESVSKQLPPVHIDLDDLAYIANGVDGKMSIVHGRFEYEGLDEASSKLGGRTLRQCKMSLGSKYPSVDIWIRPDSVRVISNGMNAEAIQVAEYLRTRSPWWAYHSERWPWGIVVLLIGVALALSFGFAIYAITGADFSVHLANLLLLVYMVGMWRSEWIIGRSNVYIGHSHRRSTFLRRNTELIVVNIIVAVISMLIGIFIGRLAS